ncbi:hypothetical protein [Alteromonas portus]
MDISSTHPTLQPMRIWASQVSVKIPSESFDVMREIGAKDVN